MILEVNILYFLVQTRTAFNEKLEFVSFHFAEEPLESTYCKDGPSVDSRNVDKFPFILDHIFTNKDKQRIMSDSMDFSDMFRRSDEAGLTSGKIAGRPKSLARFLKEPSTKENTVPVNNNASKELNDSTEYIINILKESKIVADNAVFSADALKAIEFLNSEVRHFRNF
jgi:hypothetical protein